MRKNLTKSSFTCLHLFVQGEIVETVFFSPLPIVLSSSISCLICWQSVWPCRKRKGKERGERNGGGVCLPSFSLLSWTYQRSSSSIHWNAAHLTLPQINTGVKRSKKKFLRNSSQPLHWLTEKKHLITMEGTKGHCSFSRILTTSNHREIERRKTASEIPSSLRSLCYRLLFFRAPPQLLISHIFYPLAFLPPSIWHSRSLSLPSALTCIAPSYSSVAASERRRRDAPISPSSPSNCRAVVCGTSVDGRSPPFAQMKNGRTRREVCPAWEGGRLKKRLQHATTLFFRYSQAFLFPLKNARKKCVFFLFWATLWNATGALFRAQYQISAPPPPPPPLSPVYLGGGRYKIPFSCSDRRP